MGKRADPPTGEDAAPKCSLSHSLTHMYMAATSAQIDGEKWYEPKRPGAFALSGSAMSTELAYQTYGADVGFMCGNAFLAETARVNPAYKSPVYLNYGVQVPYRCANGRHAETLC